MPTTIHVVRGNSATYELSKEVLGTIEEGFEAFKLLGDA
jgi:hypothetical protein